MVSNASSELKHEVSTQAAEVEAFILAQLQRANRNRKVELSRTTSRDSVSIDSIDMVNVLFAIEEEYGVEINLNTQESFQTVGDLIDALAASFLKDES